MPSIQRHHRQLRLLRSRLGGHPRHPPQHRRTARLAAVFEAPLALAAQIRSQQQRQRGWKLYSFHAPEVECIGKGKASAPYSSASKPRSSPPTPALPVSSSAPCQGAAGNPYDGIRSAASLMPPEAHRLRHRARLCRQDIAATTPPIRVASSSLVRSVASSASSSANCDVARQSNPSSTHEDRWPPGRCHLKAPGDAATSSSPPSATIFAAFSPG